MTLRVAMRKAAAALCLAGTAAAVPHVHADSSTSSSSVNVPRSTTASLDFTLSIQKFLFFGVGNSPWPTQSNAVSTVSFALTPSIPGGPTAPAAGNNTAVNWSGGAPAFSVAASNNMLPVEVRSNAGQITLRAEATTPLSSGTNTIPMSEITIASSNTGLPAPLIPATGPGTAVNVTGTGFTNLVTLQQANWTFSYANSASRTAGNYSGVVTFTASTP
ncbi:hypothetical protein [Variovorax sp. 770b2]|uniref:hypothetical protein n=1 Tax=Variovorax sp. 770b2 TaxID=1566271 RepID=UPI0008E45200|nr:hypothetical protein [Variovorax sp. 770b2]SFQ17391.1 hypothetical protein SAMN03159339_5866 [Variovorax sp. 770b2]